MKRLLGSVFLLLLVFNSYSFAGKATKWDVDKAHSSINFTINHWATPVHGHFDDFDIDINFNPENLEESSINATIQVASVKTGWGPRDESIKTEDWFDAKEYPTITFKSSEIHNIGMGNYIARGKLRIKGVEKEIELPFSFLGVNKIQEDMKPVYNYIDEVASFALNFSINREDYYVGTGTKNQGTAWKLYRQVVGNTVKVTIGVEGNRKYPTSAR
jgi:polyisoprenoid-binding protein YceI